MKTILFVEDDDVFSFLIVEHLKSQGYSVVLTDDGDDALKLISKNTFDWIIMDIELSSSMSGLDVAEKLRNMGDETPIVFATGDVTEETIIRVFSLSFCDYLKKPFGLTELLCRLNKVSNEADSGPSYLKFGPFRLMMDERILEKGGEKFKLSQQQYLVLCALVKQSNHLVNKETLMKTLWFNNEDLKSKEYVLNNVVYSLRKILSHSTSKINIENCKGLGYRLMVSG